jgi:transcriptional regulator GlxA family with amidase domain
METAVMTENTVQPLSIAIALFDRMTMLDAIGPYSVLAGLPNSEITFVAEEPGPVLDSNGRMAVVAQAAYADMPDPDVIVIPGGLITVSMARKRTHPIIDWIRRVHPGTTRTTSVCTGSQLLGAAGLLNGVPATSHWYVRDTLSEFGAVPTDERVVTHGRIITAAGVSAGIDMALQLVADLQTDEIAQAIQLSIEYDPDPPFNAGHPRCAPPAVTDFVSAGFAGAISSDGAES